MDAPPWTPCEDDPSLSRCSLHDERFKSYKGCRSCKPGDFSVAAPMTPAEELAAKAEIAGCPGTADYERAAFDRFELVFGWAERAASIAFPVGDEKVDPEVAITALNTAAKLAAAAGPYLGKAMDSAWKREDWERAGVGADRVGRRIRRAEFNAARAESAHPVDGRGVRH